MDSLLEWLTGFASDRNHPVGFVVLFASAMIEYVFPPIPGDTITLFGAVLITGYGWNGPGIFLVVLAGSMIGALFDYWVGLRLRARPARAGDRRRAAIDRIVARFERHGPAFLMVNRFLPGIRAFFFVAAGMAGMRARDVVLYGGISVALWTGALIALGALLGANLEALSGWVARYTAVAWGVLGAVVLLLVVWRVVRWWRARRAPPDPQPQ